MASLSDVEFRQRYRLTKDVFAYVVGLVTPLIVIRFMCGLNKPVSAELCLSMTLRYLAGGSVHDLIDLHGVSQATFYRCVWRTCEALDSVLSSDFDVTENAAMEELEGGFSRLTRGVMRGFVGALDGLAIKIDKPSLSDVPDPMAFYNRKGFFAISVQAICDSKRRFLWMSAATCGSTHDSTAFSATRLFRRLEEGLMDGRWSIAADEAYGLQNNIMTPYPGRKLPQY